MMRFLVEYNCVPLKGTLVYRAYEYSFDFKVESETELARLAGHSGTISLVIGTLQIEVGIETGAVLFLWGLHSHSAQWRRDRLPVISWKKGCLTVRFDEEPIMGVSQELAEVGEWQTTYDANTGWICVSSQKGDAAECYVEFAQNTIAGVANQKLVSLRMRPMWYEERFEEAPASFFSRLKN